MRILDLSGDQVGRNVTRTRHWIPSLTSTLLQFPSGNSIILILVPLGNFYVQLQRSQINLSIKLFPFKMFLSLVLKFTDVQRNFKWGFRCIWHTNMTFRYSGIVSYRFIMTDVLKLNVAVFLTFQMYSSLTQSMKPMRRSMVLSEKRFWMKAVVVQKVAQV
jgi:hypothetical protein